ncbi:cysteine desulfuration protein SufE [Chitinophaga skermanii]|uniref:Cysteine desulfuration protein SufE n=1 Tax=Chitinophaga skermanii TaxID=331697 RepID=A0A327QRW1_9BACT|nr:SufE family protein [Chitinophaga skermanii]RAJ06698.1 cysteine desulfuration protein SufE [Chitinophaga skermanii]
MTINEQQDAIISDFEMFTDWMDKYEYIIQLGKDLPALDEQYKVDDNLIRGCQSKVWLHADYKDGKLFFSADSDALITKGLVSLVIQALDGQPAKDIATAELYFVEKIGLKSHLSPTRSNGLLAMIKQIKMYAVAYQLKSSQN